MYGSINSFSEVDSYSFHEQLKNKIKKAVEAKGKEYILGVDEDEFKNYLISEFTIEPVEIDHDSETIEKPVISKELYNSYSSRRAPHERDFYSITVKYSFKGSGIVFKVRPSRWTMTSAQISVDESKKTVSFVVGLFDQDPDEFRRVKESQKKSAFTNLENANAEIEKWNNSVPSLVNQFFSAEKSKYKNENDFFTAINVKVDNSTKSVFSSPEIKKKVIPQPKVSNKKEFSSEPMMAKEMYEDVLKVVYDSGKSMEKKPALYTNKDEEGLRDQFLFVLETRYDSTTASGETFNRSGKTDIILKYSNDGSNLFVAECKFWHGKSEFLKAISQLFDRYLTWRDSKAAIILFVQNKEFSNVLETIKESVSDHDYFNKENGIRGESSFSFIFHLPQDSNKKVYLEIMAFHFDK